MRFDRLLVRTLRLPLRHPFRSAGGVTTHRTVLLLELEGEGLRGVAECVAPDTPHYTSETVHTARWVLEEHLAPAVVGRAFRSAGEVGAALEGAARGHPMAKAAVEMAAWEAKARSRGVSLASLLGGTRDRVAAGVAIGLGPDIEATLDRIGERVDEGYRRIKIKVSPGRDVELLAAVRGRYPDIELTADANGSYGDVELERVEALDRFRLGYLEQPFPADELARHAALRERAETPVCLDESIDGPGRCRDALALGAMDVVNIKPGRVGGHGSAREIHDLCAAAGVPAWCGGMLETGVGRAHNVALASLPNMRLPGDLSASARYWERDIVVPPFTVDAEGMVEVPTGPGLGVELDEDFIASIEVEQTELREGGT